MPSGFVDVEMLEAGATKYHVSQGGEIDQPHTVGRSCRVEAELFEQYIHTYLAQTPDIGQGLGRFLSCGARKQEQT